MLNFTAPLLNGQYIEIVCPLDHPATDATPFGQAVKKKAIEGGGWLAWVVSTNEIEKFEDLLKRESVIGIRKLPNNEQLRWKQIGILNTLNYNCVPFFVQWQTSNHPSKNHGAVAELIGIKMSGGINHINAALAPMSKTIVKLIKIEWANDNNASGPGCIEEIYFRTEGKVVKID